MYLAIPSWEWGIVLRFLENLWAARSRQMESLCSQFLIANFLSCDFFHGKCQHKYQLHLVLECNNYIQFSSWYKSLNVMVTEIGYLYKDPETKLQEIPEGSTEWRLLLICAISALNLPDSIHHFKSSLFIRRRCESIYEMDRLPIGWIFE